MAFQPKFTPKKSGVAAALEQGQIVSNALAKNSTAEQNAIESQINFASPSEASERIRIIFDDSGSMSEQKIDDAREGTIEFMRNCTLNQTAVAVHPLETPNFKGEAMTTNLPALSMEVRSILAKGGTPLFETWLRALALEPKATRYIIFSDGEPNNTINKEECISKAIELKTPCDTVFITQGYSYNDNSAEALLKEIAERTGGIYLRFDRNKVNFKTAFKYLAPTLRLQLVSDNTRKALEEGMLK